MIFFVQKCELMQKLHVFTFFQQEIIFAIGQDRNFKDTLANNFIVFNNWALINFEKELCPFSCLAFCGNKHKLGE